MSTIPYHDLRHAAGLDLHRVIPHLSDSLRLCHKTENIYVPPPLPHRRLIEM